MGRKKSLTVAKLVFLLGSRQDGFGKLADNISLMQTAKEQNPPKTSPKELTFKNRIIKKNSFSHSRYQHDNEVLF